MQRFFIKALFFLVGASLLLNLAGTLADRAAPLDDWRAEHEERFASLQARKDRIEAVTLGNSHSDAIEYSVLGIEGQSLAFVTADLFEIEKYAASLQDELPNLKTVFVAISYYSFSRDNATFGPSRTRRIRYYSMIPTRSPIQGDLANFVLGKLESATHVMSVVRSDHWQSVWVELANDGPPPDPFPYDGVRTSSAWGLCSHYTEEQLEPHAKEIAARNVASSLQMAQEHLGLVQDASGALARTIEGLQSRGIQVILFTPPYYEKYNAYFDEQGSSLTEELRQAMATIQQTYQVTYYDFSRDPEITPYPELFYNSDHLSDCGVKVFTAKLLEAMIANGDFDR